MLVKDDCIEALAKVENIVMDASQDQLDRVVELVWWNPVEHGTTIPAGIWAVQSRVTQSELTA